MRSPFCSLEERRAAFEAARLYPVVSPEFCSGRELLFVVENILAGGGKILQLRCKHPESDRRLWECAVKVRQLTAAAGALLIIDDRVDIALASGADGVHLGQDDLPLAAAKAAAPELLIGVSTHNISEIRQAVSQNADYLNVGPIFPTRTKEVSYPVVGLENLKSYLSEITIPFSVMGGIKAHHLPELKTLGIKHPAMVTEITQAENIAERTAELISML